MNEYVESGYTLLILKSGCEVLKSTREALATQGTCTASAMSVCL